MIVICDYDAGNLHSVQNAISYLGYDSVASSDPKTIRAASKVIMPGVGSFGDARRKLDAYGLSGTLQDILAADTPFLGICLGLQLLFESSEESPGIPGLGFLSGRIVRFTDRPGYKIPQIGWNNVTVKHADPVLEGISADPYFYFVHSYYAKADDPGVVLGTCDYTDTADVLIKKGNVYACQFHPEKSGREGLRLLDNFLKL